MSNPIPQSVRDIIDERDKGFCRFCGTYLGELRSHHHCEFGGIYSGMGGKRIHDPDKMISVCNGLYGNQCHEKIHGNKALYLPYTLEVVKHPGKTIIQLMKEEGNDVGD